MRERQKVFIQKMKKLISYKEKSENEEEDE